ncbi:MAG: hypothetical protein R2822_24295 [Spirosomataceae bacterium]
MKHKTDQRFRWLFLVYGLINIGFALFRQYPLKSDSLIYFQWASKAAQMNTFFPYPEAIYDPWLASLFHVNIGSLLLRVYNAPVTVHLLNVAMNLMQLYLVYRLTLQFFGRQSAWIVACIYVLYLNNLGFVVLNFSELTFTACCLWSLYFYFQKPTFFTGLWSGLTAGFALGCRPLVVALLLIYGLVWLWHLNNKRYTYHQQLMGIGLGVLLL